MSSRGLLVVIAGPSGAGKTTLARHLIETFPEAVFSVSFTTRPPRGNERDGLDYRFVSHNDFSGLVASSHFLEWAEVHGNRYGTSGEWVRTTLASGGSVVLDIDVQGALQVKRALPAAVLVFVLPPDPAELGRRLSGRGTDSGDTVSKRLSAAAREVALLGAFDYFIVNDALASSRLRIETVYRAERMRLAAQSWPPEAVPYHTGVFSGLSAWKGKRVIVCSGPTREGMDDVRFISNRSSGLMGLSMVNAFLDAGALVTMISGPCRYDAPPGSVPLIRVETADEMLAALHEAVAGADLLVMAAAVGDYRPKVFTPGKLCRGDGFLLELEPTPDLLESLDAPCPVLSFSLEYGPECRERALEKMRRKGSFAVFVNRGDIPGQGMESETNLGELIFADGSSADVPSGSKRFVALAIAGLLGERL
ncbi:MAG: guanylate kinase [Candidatus Fermentibacteraceae bacterium]